MLRFCGCILPAETQLWKPRRAAEYAPYSREVLRVTLLDLVGIPFAAILRR